MNQKPRLLVIGASGFVGAHVARLAQENFAVTCGLRRPTGPNAVAIDIIDPASVSAAFDLARPDAVILTAALADIDRCEHEQSFAEQVNFYGPLHVARECQQRGARLVFTSTDAVFDGTLHAYAEDAVPTPVNFYGKTKARAEAGIAATCPQAAIVRVSLVLGRGLAVGTNSYVDKLATSFAAHKAVLTPTFEFRNPIDVTTLSRVLLDLAGRDAQGIFHLGASDKMARYDLARQIAVALGAPPELVEPQDAPTAGRAPRGLDDFLVCERLPKLLGLTLPNCLQVIEKAVHGSS